VIITEDVYLEHFGVKGMKWGIRRRPDQLTPSKSDTDVTKGVKKDYNDLSDGDFFKKYATTKGRYAKRVAKFGDPYARAVDKISGNAGELTPGEAMLAVYGGLFVAAILSQGVKQITDSGRRDAKKSKDIPLKKNTNLSKSKSLSQLHKDVVKPINSEYGAKGTKMNCRRATLAYEMRRRGYDVKATKSKYATGQTTKNLRRVSSISKDQKFQSIWGETQVAKPRDFAHMTPQKKAEAVFASLSKNPNGARGELGNSWFMGGGHSMAWEIVNNKPVIFDTQNGKMYKNASEYSAFTPAVLEVAHTRLDNKEIDEEFIKRWVTNAG
jgi:Papain fold toxin 1, glutamine deamidase